jgi:nicotinate-nucleotide adenylyltransferase
MIKDRTVVVLGGAFNPPTNAHYRLYQETKKGLHFDHFIYLPVHVNYPKADLVSNHHRRSMLETMTQNDEDVVIEGYELDQPTFQGTYHTLKALEKKYQATVIFALGTDQVITLKDWIEAERLVNEFQFIVFERQARFKALIQNDPFLQRVAHRCMVIQMDDETASNDYRTHKNNSLLHPNVLVYIKTHHLYEDPL